MALPATAAAAARVQAAQKASAQAAAQARVQAAQAARVRAREASAAAAKVQAAAQAAKKAEAAPITLAIPRTVANAGGSYSQPAFTGSVMLAANNESAKKADANLTLEYISEQRGSAGAAARVVKKANSAIGTISSITSDQPLSGVDNIAIAGAAARLGGPRAAIVVDGLYSGSYVDEVVDGAIHASVGENLVKTVEVMLTGANALPFNQGGNPDGMRSMLGFSGK
jgi:hypothetical protein